MLKCEGIMNTETPDRRGDYQIQVWIDSEQVDEGSASDYTLAKWFYDQAVIHYPPNAFIGLLCRPTGYHWPTTQAERSWWVSKRAAA